MSQIAFQTLAYTDIESLLKCFNESFKNYFVPLQLTREQFAEKLYAEAVDLKLSFGALHNNQLVAFILNGIDTIDNTKTAYGAGTGVLPAYRGHRLSQSLYEYGMPHLKDNGVKKYILEVIDQNIAAIKTYESTGFIIKRKLINYIGKVKCDNNFSTVIKAVMQPDWNMVNEMPGWQRSWQYNNNTLKRSWDNYIMLVAYSGNIAEAYCIVNFKNGRIACFGSKNKNREHLCSLFAHLGSNIKNPLTIIYIDENEAEIDAFLISIGLHHFIVSYEMERPVD